MNIDSSLVDFQTNVGGNLSQIENEKVNLSSDISALKSINISISDSLFTSFKSEAGDSIKPEIEYINQTISKIQESLEVELGTAISKAQELNSGIDELKILLDEYNSAKDKYNSLKNVKARVDIREDGLYVDLYVYVLEGTVVSAIMCKIQEDIK